MDTNSTHLKIENNTVRYFWVAYHIFVLLSSLIGDSLILYASFQKNSFKLNKFIVAIIQHIAVCDIGFAISSVLPIAISLLADSWVLGKVMCFARVYLGHVIYPTGMYLLAFLTASKMLLLKYPIRCSNWTAKRAHIIYCLIPAIIGSSYTTLFAVIDWDDVAYNDKVYTCDYLHSSDIWKQLRYPLIILNMFAPNLIIMTTTIPTLMYLAAARKSAKRVRGSVPWQGALTVALTAIVSSISVFPSIVYTVWATATAKEDARVARTAQFLLAVNIMSNFYIYALTIKSFQQLLRRRFRFLLSKLTASAGNYRSLGIWEKFCFI